MSTPEDGWSEAGVRERLFALRAEATSRLAGLDRSLGEVVAAAQDANADDEHDPEGATIGFERAQVSSLARSARETLAEVDAALERLDSGRYGTCERCGRPIAGGRLEARPTARTCVECAARR